MSNVYVYTPVEVSDPCTISDIPAQRYLYVHSVLVVTHTKLFGMDYFWHPICELNSADVSAHFQCKPQSICASVFCVWLTQGSVYFMMAEYMFGKSDRNPYKYMLWHYSSPNPPPPVLNTSDPY